MNTTTVQPQEQPAYPTLAAALRTGSGDYFEAAAVDILIDMPHRLYVRPDIFEKYVVIDTEVQGQPRCARIRWITLGRDLGATTVSVSSAERRMLLIACSLAAGTPISLSEVLVGLDVASAATLTIAVDRVVRRLR